MFGAPFYVMERIDGVPVRSGIPEAWVAAARDAGPRRRGARRRARRGARGRLAGASASATSGTPSGFLERQVDRWLSQLASYGGRELPVAHDIGRWLDDHRPAEQPPVLFHGDYKLDNVLFATDAPPRLLAVVDWEMASIGDPLVDLAWALIFHPEPGATMPLGAHGDHRVRARARCRRAPRWSSATPTRSGRDVSAIDWYHVFSRWKLAIVLEGSYAKFVRGESSKPVHEYFGRQADLLLASAAAAESTEEVRREHADVRR